MSKTKLTSDETKYLMEYMLNNETKKTFNLGTFPFTVKTLTVAEQLNAHSSLDTFKGSQLAWSQQLRLALLSFGLVSVNNKVFEDDKECLTYLLGAPSQLVDKFAEAQKSLEDSIKELLSKSDDFSGSPSSSKD